jgi:aryl-alcohol dehydrogenase-like predicted oxidoreductase
MESRPPDSSTLERIWLGKTELRISPLGIGTWQWGDRFFWDYGKGGYSDEDLRAAFQDGLQAGINFFDTAETYGRGRSETLLGEFARSANQPLVIATKFMPYPWRLRKRSLILALKRSLERLGMERVDLYQIHWPSPPISIETWVSAIAGVLEEGLTRSVGVSNFNKEQTLRSVDILSKKDALLASNQVNYSLFDRTAEKNGLLKTCHGLGVTLIAYSPLAQGLLTGKYTPDNPMKGMRNWRYRKYLAKIQPLIGLMREIGQDHDGKSPSQVALNWVICKGAVPIPGAKNARQAIENSMATGWRLTPEEVLALDNASEME